MQRDVQNYVSRRISFMRADRASIAQSPRIQISRLPHSADDLLLFEASLRVDGRPEGLLERLRRAAARHPGDAYAKRVLAHAEAINGDGEAADGLLGELLAATPGDAELLYLRGMRELVAGEREPARRTIRFGRARSWFERSHRADPNH